MSWQEFLEINITYGDINKCGNEETNRKLGVIQKPQS
jgi:hypothetical protein